MHKIKHKDIKNCLSNFYQNELKEDWNNLTEYNNWEGSSKDQDIRVKSIFVLLCGDNGYNIDLSLDKICTPGLFQMDTMLVNNNRKNYWKEPENTAKINEFEKYRDTIGNFWFLPNKPHPEWPRNNTLNYYKQRTTQDFIDLYLYYIQLWNNGIDGDNFKKEFPRESVAKKYQEFANENKHFFNNISTYEAFRKYMLLDGIIINDEEAFPESYFEMPKIDDHCIDFYIERIKLRSQKIANLLKEYNL